MITLLITDIGFHFAFCLFLVAATPSRIIQSTRTVRHQLMGLLLVCLRFHYSSGERANFAIFFVYRTRNVVEPCSTKDVLFRLSRSNGPSDRGW